MRYHVRTKGTDVRGGVSIPRSQSRQSMTKRVRGTSLMPLTGPYSVIDHRNNEQHQMLSCVAYCVTYLYAKMLQRQCLTFWLPPLPVSIDRLWLTLFAWATYTACAYNFYIAWRADPGFLKPPMADQKRVCRGYALVRRGICTSRPWSSV